MSDEIPEIKVKLEAHDPTIKKSWADLEKEAFDNFMYLIWEPNPLRDRVTVIVDGEQKMYIQRDRYISMLKQVLNESDPVIRDTFSKIELSIYEYGGWFFYDRNNNEFKELHENAPLEKLTPHQVRDEIMKDEGGSKTSYVSSEMEQMNNAFQKPIIEKPKIKRPDNMRVFKGGRM